MPSQGTTHSATDCTSVEQRLAEAWRLRSQRPTASLDLARNVLAESDAPSQSYWESRLLEAAALSRLGARDAAIPKLNETRAAFDAMGDLGLRALCDLALGMAFLRDGESQASIEAITNAEATLRELGHAEHPGALQHLGLVLHLFGDLDRAAACFDEAERLTAPESKSLFIVLVNRGSLHVERQQWTRAHEDAERARQVYGQLVPSGPIHRAYLAHLLVLQLQLAMGDGDSVSAATTAAALTDVASDLQVGGRSRGYATLADWCLSLPDPDVDGARANLERGLDLVVKDRDPMAEELLCRRLAAIERDCGDYQACHEWRDRADVIRERRRQRSLHRRVEVAAHLHHMQTLEAEVQKLAAGRDALQREVAALEVRAGRQAGLIAEIGHDIRSPLTAVILGAELLAEGLSGDERDDALSVWQAGAQIQDLLDALAGTRHASGHRAWRVTANPLAKLLQRTVDGWQIRARAKGQTVRLRGCVDETLQGDTTAIRQIMDNLVGNALKVTPAGGQVEFEGLRVGSAIEILVDDDGPGIPDAEAELVFNRFFRGSQLPTCGERSTGLGLSLVRHLVERHGGTVRVQRAALGGARLRVRLPLAGDGDAGGA